MLTRIWIAVLCGTLAAQPVWSQSASPAPVPPGEALPASAPPAPGQAAPMRLQIKVLSPVPLTEPAGALSANQVAVLVLDGWGMPVPGAAVSFRLPEAGPGGVFLNGLSTEVAIADREGKAVVKGFDWRAETGTSFLHVIAAYGEVRSGAMVEVQLGRRVSGLPPAAAASGARPAPKPAASGDSSAFPLPAEARTPVRQSAASPADQSAVAPAPSRGAPVSSRQTAGAHREAVVPAIPPAPRDLPPIRPAADYQSPEAAADSASYVTVKSKSGGSNKMLILLVVAAAAAGGALAAGVASGGTSSSPGSSTNPTTPTISIGSPSITVTGGSN